MVFSPPPPPKKKQQKQVTKNILKNESTYRDGMPKKQPNKVGMTPQYSYGLSSLYLLPFFQPHTYTHTMQSPACHTSYIHSQYNIVILHNATHMTPSTTTYPPQQYTLETTYMYHIITPHPRPQSTPTSTMTPSSSTCNNTLCLIQQNTL